MGDEWHEFVETTSKLANHFRESLEHFGCYTLDDEAMAERWWHLNKGIIAATNPQGPQPALRKKLKIESDVLLDEMLERVERARAQFNGSLAPGTIDE